MFIESYKFFSFILIICYLCSNPLYDIIESENSHHTNINIIPENNELIEKYINTRNNFTTYLLKKEKIDTIIKGWIIKIDIYRSRIKKINMKIRRTSSFLSGFNNDLNFINHLELELNNMYLEINPILYYNIISHLDYSKKIQRHFQSLKAMYYNFKIKLENYYKNISYFLANEFCNISYIIETDDKKVFFNILNHILEKDKSIYFYFCAEIINEIILRIKKNDFDSEIFSISYESALYNLGISDFFCCEVFSENNFRYIIKKWIDLIVLFYDLIDTTHKISEDHQILNLFYEIEVDFFIMNELEEISHKFLICANEPIYEEIDTIMSFDSIKLVDNNNNFNMFNQIININVCEILSMQNILYKYYLHVKKNLEEFFKLSREELFKKNINFNKFLEPYQPKGYKGICLKLLSFYELLLKLMENITKNIFQSEYFCFRIVEIIAFEKHIFSEIKLIQPKIKKISKIITLTKISTNKYKKYIKKQIYTIKKRIKNNFDYLIVNISALILQNVIFTHINHNKKNEIYPLQIFNNFYEHMKMDFLVYKKQVFLDCDEHFKGMIIVYDKSSLKYKNSIYYCKCAVKMQLIKNYNLFEKKIALKLNSFINDRELLYLLQNALIFFYESYTIVKIYKTIVLFSVNEAKLHKLISHLYEDECKILKKDGFENNKQYI